MKSSYLLSSLLLYAVARQSSTKIMSRLERDMFRQKWDVSLFFELDEPSRPRELGDYRRAMIASVICSVEEAP